MGKDGELERLARIGRLMDEALDMADAAAEPLIAAHLAQALHVLDQRVAHVRNSLPLIGVPSGSDAKPAEE